MALNTTFVSNKDPLSVGDTLAIVAIVILILTILWAMAVIIQRLITRQWVFTSLARALRGRMIMRRRRRAMASASASQAPATNVNVCPPRDVEEAAADTPLPPSPTHPRHGVDLPRPPLSRQSSVSSLNTLDGLEDVDLGDNTPPSPVDMLGDDQRVSYAQAPRQEQRQDGAWTAS
jgi:hypothetical protein